MTSTAISGAPDPVLRRAFLAGLALVLVLYAVLGHDERHHWHEWRYLYSAANYTVAELRDGAFDPGPPPERSAVQIGAWYWGQLLHESLLRLGVQLLGPGPGTIAALLWLYGLWLPLTAFFTARVLQRLSLGVDPWRIAAVLLLSPLGLYLSFKFMAEGLALCLASAALWSFLEGAARTTLRRALLWSAAAVLAGLSFLVMSYIPLLLAAFLAAWSLGLNSAGAGRRVAVACLLVFVGVACALGGAKLFYDLDIADYAFMYGDYRAYVKPIEISLYGAATAWSALYAFALVGSFSAARPARRFFLIWFLAAAVPFAILSSNYIESRFLAVAILPLAGLSVLGIDAVAAAMARRLRGVSPGALSWAAILVVVPLVSALSLPFMPYEMSSGELRRVVSRVLAREPDAAILVPWNYTDFHYLRLALPDGQVYLVQAPFNKAGERIDDPAWRARRARQYGPAFVADAQDLERLAGRPLYYVGHGILPPFQATAAVSAALGLGFVADRIERLDPVLHVARSWMWRNPAYAFEEEEGEGNYRLFRVEKRGSAVLGAIGRGTL